MPGPGDFINWQDTVPASNAPIAQIGTNQRLLSGTWTPAPSIFRLRLVGTGTAVVSSRDRLLNEASVGSYVASGATNQIEFPYLGDAAVEIKVDYPEALTVEILP